MCTQRPPSLGRRDGGSSNLRDKALDGGATIRPICLPGPLKVRTAMLLADKSITSQRLGR
jgi:hypothetical protein